MKHCQPIHQNPQQALFGDGIKSAVTTFQSAVQNLLCEADVKAWVGSSMIWSGQGIFSSKWPGYTCVNWSIFQVTESYLEPLLKINEQLRLQIANDTKIE